MRVKYVDGFRGFALLSMVFLHFYDALSVTSIYTDAPVYIKEINNLIINPLSLFAFVSGISAYLFITKYSSTHTKRETSLKTIKTYGKYILLSLPFTLFMWDAQTFIQWNEAIQGIGLSALVTALIINYFKPKTPELTISIILITLTRYYLMIANPLIDVFPYNPELVNPLILLGSTGLNALFRGTFSIFNLLPLMLSGIIFYKATNKYSINKLLISSTALTIISLLLHYNGFPINFYAKSINFTLFGISTACMTNAIILYFYNKENRINKILTRAGIMSLSLYVWHHLIFIKPISMFYKDTLTEIPALTLSIILTTLSYLIVKHVRLTLKPASTTILKQENTTTE